MAIVNDFENQPMTRILTFLAGIMISQCAFAQLPDGSIAPDFTATDINGTTHNLQSYLDEGKSGCFIFRDVVWTVLEFF